MRSHSSTAGALGASLRALSTCTSLRIVSMPATNKKKNYLSIIHVFIHQLSEKDMHAIADGVPACNQQKKIY
jgi:hypothetical protein